jgi:hypothetical protein
MSHIPDFHQMKESATARTPVEIWRHIFQFVIKTRLHSYDNDSIVHDLELFIIGCKSGRQYIESERNRTNLRLVCRSWNIELQNAGDGLMMVDLQNIYDWPSKEIISAARRVEFVHKSEVWCRCEKLPCSRVLCLKQRPRSRVRPDGFWDGQYPHLEALLVHHVTWHGQKLLEHAPALRLLLWSLIGQRYGTNYSTLHNLTHLFLDGVCHTGLKTIVGNIFMPEVTMLWLKFSSEVSGNFEPCSTLTEWRFPKLKRLMLSGTCREEIWDDIKGFISACRITIRELGMTMGISWKGRKCSPTQNHLDEVLNNLPNLVTFGTIIQEIWEVPPPSLGVKSAWSLLLFQIPSSFVKHWEIPLQRMVSGYGIEKVVFDNTWEDIRIIMKEDNWRYHSKVLKYVRTAFDMLEKEGILVCDINGVTSMESYGRDFLSWLTPQARMSLVKPLPLQKAHSNP